MYSQSYTSYDPAYRSYRSRAPPSSRGYEPSGTTQKPCSRSAGDTGYADFRGLTSVSIDPKSFAHDAPTERLPEDKSITDYLASGSTKTKTDLEAASEVVKAGLYVDWYKANALHERYNQTILIHNGLRSATVVALVHNILPVTGPPAVAGTVGAAAETLRRAYNTILGKKSPFCAVKVQVALKELFEHPFSAIVYGIRHPDEKITPVKTYLYSEKKEFRVALAKLKPIWDPVLPLILVDPDDTCATRTNDPKCHDTAWLCGMEDKFKDFEKSLRIPSEEHQLAIFPYFMSKYKTAASAGVASSFVVASSCSPCEQISHTRALTFLAGGTSVELLIMQHGFMYFLCWLSGLNTKLDAPAEKLTGAMVEKWNMCLYGTKEIKVKTVPADKYLEPQDTFKDTGESDQDVLRMAYGRELWIALWTFKKLLEEAWKTEYPDNNTEEKCLGTLLCLKQDLFKCLEKWVEEVDNPKKGAADEHYVLTKTDRTKEVIDECELVRFKTKMSHATSKFCEFIDRCQEAIDVGFINEVSATRKFVNVFCKLTTKVVPWFYAATEGLDSLYLGVKLATERHDTPCVGRITISSPLIIRQQIIRELIGVSPEVFSGNSAVPNEEQIQRLIASGSDSDAATLAKQYWAIQTTLEVAKRRADADVCLNAVCDAEAEYSDLLTWASNKQIIDTSAKALIGRWVFGVLNEFKAKLGQTDGKIVEGALKKRKETDKRLRGLAKGAIEGLRTCMETLTEILLIVGENALLDDVISSKNEDVAKGLNALVAAKNDKNQAVHCTLSKSVRCGEALALGAAETLGRIAKSLKKAPEGPARRSATFDMEAYPYSQFAIPGAIDQQMWVPFYSTEGPGYWKL